MKNIDSSKIIKVLMDELGYKTVIQFAEDIGVSTRSVYAVTQGMNGVSNHLADKIIEKFPNVSYLYLIKGELPMFTDRFKKVKKLDDLLGSDLSDVVDYNLEILEVLKGIQENISQQNKILEEFMDAFIRKSGL